MNRKHRILIVDGQTMFRAAMKALLLENPDVEVVGEAENGSDAVRLTGALQADLVLMEATMPGMNGAEAANLIKRRYPETRVLILTAHSRDDFIHECMRAGAKGYLLKDATRDEFDQAIRCVLRGGTYLSPEISAKVVDGFRNVDGTPQQSSGWDALTHRERQVLKLIAEGHHNKFVASYFSLSIKTVEKHRSNLMKKLDIHNISRLTSYAIERGVVSV